MPKHFRLIISLIGIAGIFFSILARCNNTAECVAAFEKAALDTYSYTGVKGVKYGK